MWLARYRVVFAGEGDVGGWLWALRRQGSCRDTFVGCLKITEDKTSDVNLANTEATF